MIAYLASRKMEVHKALHLNITLKSRTKYEYIERGVFIQTRICVLRAHTFKSLYEFRFRESDL